MPLELGIDHAQRQGVPARVVPYAEGGEGIRMSVEEIARQARLARHDLDLRRWVYEKYAACGFDGRAVVPTVQQGAQCLLDGVRGQTIYVSDPAGTEWIQAPHVTLCLRDQCIPMEDCDGLLTAYIGACLCANLPAYVVVQQFGPGVQPHVLAGFIDEHGQKLYGDPANTTAPIYAGSRALSEVWIDPMEQVGETGQFGPDFVTLGRAPLGLGDAAVAYQKVTDSVVHAGLRYRVGMMVTYAYDPTGNYRAQQETRAYFEPNWLVESLTSQAPAQFVPGIEQWIEPFIMQAVAKTDQTLSDDDFVRYLSVYVQASSPNPSPPPPPSPVPVLNPNRQAPRSNVNYASAVLVTLGIGAAAGAAWETFKLLRRRSRRTRTA